MQSAFFFQKEPTQVVATEKSTNQIISIKGQLNSEWIYEVIISPKMPTENLKDVFPESLLEGRAEILQSFGWHFGRNDDLTN